MMQRMMRCLAVVGIGALAAAAGCGAQQKPGGSIAEFNEERAASLQEAMRLAEQAQAAQADGRTREAIELYQKSIQSRRDLFSVWNNYGVALMTIEDYMGAADAFRTAADLSPTDPRPYENLGLIYLERGFDEDALRYYGLALGRDGNYLPALRGATLAAKRLLRSDEQIAEWIRRGIMQETNPEWLEIFRSQRIRVEGELRDRQRRG